MSSVCGRLPLPSRTFLVLPYAHPPAPHSFPTRRSSDLRPGPGGLGVPRLIPPFPLPPRRGGHPRTGSTIYAQPLLRKPDRKSTRLNSSHVAISYAVFCLKKKRRISEDERITMRARYGSS